MCSKKRQDIQRTIWKYEKKKGISLLAVILAGVLLIVFSLWGIWSMNSPSNLGVSFPEGTQIMEETDTHQGIFRNEGGAAVVAQVPPEKIQSFEKQLRNEGFIEFPPLDHVRKLLKTVEAAAPVLDAERILWTYRDEAIAFVEEPFSDYFAAVYDLETGICCYIEYDS